MENLSPAKYIQEWGGKIGGNLFLRDLGGFEKHLPYADFLKADQDFSLIKNKDRYQTFGDNDEFARERPVIVRGSHPNDHDGLVDAIDSEADIYTPESIIKAIDSIRRNANRREVFSYSRFEGQPYDGRIRIMIADQLMKKSYRNKSQPEEGLYRVQQAPRGSIIEHPHERDTYLIELVTKTGRHEVEIDRVVVRDYDIVHCMNDGENVDLSNLGSAIFRDGRFLEIIELYEKVRSTSFIPSTKSFQMEFGRTDNPPNGKANVQFFQMRPFLDFQEPTFSLGDHDSSNYTCFGITPKEGIELPVQVVADGNEREITKINEPYAMIVEPSGLIHTLIPVDLMFHPRNMEVYLGAGVRASSLEHLNYRWVKQARISVLDNEVIPNFRSGRTSRVKVISNGINSIVEEVEE